MDLVIGSAVLIALLFISFYWMKNADPQKVCVEPSKTPKMPIVCLPKDMQTPRSIAEYLVRLAGLEKEFAEDKGGFSFKDGSFEFFIEFDKNYLSLSVETDRFTYFNSEYNSNGDFVSFKMFSNICKEFKKMRNEK